VTIPRKGRNYTAEGCGMAAAAVEKKTALGLVQNLLVPMGGGTKTDTQILQMGLLSEIRSSCVGRQSR
jgi:hypothetical protein